MVALDFFPGAAGDASSSALLQYGAGWLRASDAFLATPSMQWQRTLIACVTDTGTVLPAKVALAIFDLPTAPPRVAEEAPPDRLALVMDELYAQFLEEADAESLRYLRAVKEQAETQIKAFDARAKSLLDRVGELARALRAERRDDDLSAEGRHILRTKIERLSDMQNRVAEEMRQRAADLRDNTEALAADVLAALRNRGELTHKATVRWRCLA